MLVRGGDMAVPFRSGPYALALEESVGKLCPLPEYIEERPEVIAGRWFFALM